MHARPQSAQVTNWVRYFTTQCLEAESASQNRDLGKHMKLWGTEAVTQSFWDVATGLGGEDGEKHSAGDDGSYKNIYLFIYIQGDSSNP